MKRSDLPPEVEDAAAVAAKLAHHRAETAPWGLVVDAVVAVVAPEIARPLQARIAELEAEVARRKLSGEALNTECEQIGEKADEAWLALNPYIARVELLTAALTDAIEALGWASDYVSVPWPKAYQLEPLRAALAAGEAGCRFCGEPESDTVWCCDERMEADGPTESED